MVWGLACERGRDCTGAHVRLTGMAPCLRGLEGWFICSTIRVWESGGGCIQQDGLCQGTPGGGEFIYVCSCTVPGDMITSTDFKDVWCIYSSQLGLLVPTLAA